MASKEFLAEWNKVSTPQKPQLSNAERIQQAIDEQKAKYPDKPQVRTPVSTVVKGASPREVMTGIPMPKTTPKVVNTASTVKKTDARAVNAIKTGQATTQPAKATVVKPTTSTMPSKLDVENIINKPKPKSRMETESKMNLDSFNSGKRYVKPEETNAPSWLKVLGKSLGAGVTDFASSTANMAVRKPIEGINMALNAMGINADPEGGLGGVVSLSLCLGKKS